MVDPEAVNPRPIRFSNPDDDTAPAKFIEGLLSQLLVEKTSGKAYGQTTLTFVWRGNKPPRVQIVDATEVRFEDSNPKKTDPPAPDPR